MDRHVQAWRWIGSISLLYWGLRPQSHFPTTCWQVLFLKTLQVETSTFVNSPHQANNMMGGRVESSYKHNSKQKSWNFNRSNKHNGKYANENTLFQGDTNSGSTRKINIYSQVGIKIILVGSTSKCPDRRKTKTFCKKVAISNNGLEYFRNCEGYIKFLFFLNPCNSSCQRKFISV